MKNNNLLIRELRFFIALLSLFFMPGCLSTTITDVKSSIGQEYHVLKFPTDKHNIGSEWSRQFNATGKGALTDDKIRVEKSLKRMDQGTAHQVALGIAALTNGGASGSAGIDASVVNQLCMHDLQIIKPVSPGYIDFKPGIVYVGEALRLEGFALSGERKLALQAKAGGGDSPGNGSANIGFSNGSNEGMSGEGLVIGYVLQSVDESTYRKKESEPKVLILDGNRTALKDFGITASASYEAIVPGSGKPLPKNLLWACKRAASRKDTINAAWVVTVAMAGQERKTLKIAFPAYPEVEECSDYDGIISTGINSATDMIERTRLDISLEKASMTEMLEPREFSANISAIQESFKIKSVTLQ
jgi:hypothetical protein